jgi:hypothetical protein
MLTLSAKRTTLGAFQNALRKEMNTISEYTQLRLRSIPARSTPMSLSSRNQSVG